MWCCSIYSAAVSFARYLRFTGLGLGLLEVCLHIPCMGNFSQHMIFGINVRKSVYVNNFAPSSYLFGDYCAARISGVASTRVNRTPAPHKLVQIDRLFSD